MIGYLQHGAGTQGPFRTERVTVRNHGDGPEAWFEECWRVAYQNEKGEHYVIYHGEKIPLQITE